MVFKDRKEAGRLLAEKLINYKGEKETLVLGIPRGGVVIAAEISNFLNLPLDIVVTRKIGHPQNPELAVAAVDEDGEITKEGFAETLSLDGFLEKEAYVQKNEIKRRLKEYRDSESHADFRDKTCIIADDGIATGLTTISAIKFLKKKGADQIILAVPIIPEDKIEIFTDLTDELIYLDSPQIFFAVGQFYEDFPQVEDEEVKKIIKSKK